MWNHLFGNVKIPIQPEANNRPKTVRLHFEDLRFWIFGPLSQTEL